MKIENKEKIISMLRNCILLRFDDVPNRVPACANEAN